MITTFLVKWCASRRTVGIATAVCSVSETITIGCIREPRWQSRREKEAGFSEVSLNSWLKYTWHVSMSLQTILCISGTVSFIVSYIFFCCCCCCKSQCNVFSWTQAFLEDEDNNTILCYTVFLCTHMFFWNIQLPWS